MVNAYRCSSKYLLWINALVYLSGVTGIKMKSHIQWTPWTNFNKLFLSFTMSLLQNKLYCFSWYNIYIRISSGPPNRTLFKVNAYRCYSKYLLWTYTLVYLSGVTGMKMKSFIRLTPWANFNKLFLSFTLSMLQNKLYCFSWSNVYIRLSSGPLNRTLFKVNACRHSSKYLLWTNALAYLYGVTGMKMKSFIRLTPCANLINHFFHSNKLYCFSWPNV
jgi:hypothetical protein